MPPLKAVSRGWTFLIRYVSMYKYTTKNRKYLTGILRVQRLRNTISFPDDLTYLKLNTWSFEISFVSLLLDCRRPVLLFRIETNEAKLDPNVPKVSPGAPLKLNGFKWHYIYINTEFSGGAFYGMPLIWNRLFQILCRGRLAKPLQSRVRQSIYRPSVFHSLYWSGMHEYSRDIEYRCFVYFLN